jgi:WD40 repeat protein
MRITLNESAAIWAVMLIGALAAPTGAQPTGVVPVKLDLHGDPLPAGAIARLGTIRWCHGAPVFFVAYTADGKSVITASHDGTARLWEAATGKEIRRFGKTPKNTPHRDDAEKLGGVVFVDYWYNYSISSVALAPDGLRLAVGDSTDTITLYEVATGKELTRIKMSVPDKWMGYASVGCMVFTPDGKSIVARVGHDDMLHQWDVANGKETRKFGPADFGFGRAQGSPSMAFSPDGKTFYAGAKTIDGESHRPAVIRFDVGTGKELPLLKGPTGVFHALSFAPDGKHLVWGGNEGTASLWDIAADKEIHLLVNGQQEHSVTAFSFSPDSKTVAARFHDQSLGVWDVASGKPVHRLGMVENQATLNTSALLGGYALSNLAFSPDGKYLVAGAAGNKVRQWDLGTGKEIGQVAGPSGAVLTLNLSADGKTAATRCYDNIMHVWDAGSGRETRRIGLPGIAYTACAADGRTMAMGADDGRLYTWDFRTGKEIKQWKAVQNQMGLLGLAVSADGKTIASRDQQTISLWDPSTGKELRHFPAGPVEEGPSSAIFDSVAVSIRPNMIFSPDGTLLATFSRDEQPTRAQMRAFLPKANKEAGGSEIRLWDVATGKHVRKFEVTEGGVSCFAFAPDGRTIATGNNDETISLLECASGKERSKFKTGDVGALELLTFLPDGKTLLGAGHHDPTIRFWHKGTGKELAQIKGHQSGISSLALAADGKTLISGSLDTTALVYPTPTMEHSQAPAIEMDAARADALWNDLASSDAKKAGEAIRHFTSAPKQAVVSLRARVRSVTAPDPKRVTQLIADLDSDHFAVRSKATEELEKLGDRADAAMQQALVAEPNLEVRMRLEKLRDRLVTDAPPPTETLRALRALEILEGVGTPEARQVVEALAKGSPGARLTREAQATLKRLLNQ